MTASSILEVLWAQGFTVELGPGDKLLVSPSSTLHDSQRELLRANKPAIVEFLLEERRQAEAQAAELIAAAMRACDHHGDGPEARAEMERECLALPPHLQIDLLAHFRQTYGGQEC